MKISAIIVDDQSTGRTVLRDMLAHTDPDIEIVAMATGGREAIEMINQLAPDLVFLDVQMPEVDGFGVLEQIKLPRMPIIVFVTGRDDFALKAFEAHALDYLIKPCQMARLRSAIQRARQQLVSHHAGDIQQKLDGLLQDLKAGSKYPERLAVKSNGRIVFLKLTDIDLVEAADNYVKLYVSNETHMLRETMTALEQKLPPDRFVRISRSTIVNIESVKELHPMFHGEYMVSLRNGTRVTLTRGYREQLRQLGVMP
jgi:two-component system, LytTR family, response regulator